MNGNTLPHIIPEMITLYFYLNGRQIVGISILG